MAEYSTKTPPQNPTTSYTTTDHLGTPRVITDALGQVKSRRDFMPFGEELTINVGERSQGLKYGTSDDIRQKFTGYQKDEETNLDFAEARMYENRHARFTAVDPLLASGKSANPQTFNRYVYVGNNPVNVTDPLGLDWYFNSNADSKKGELAYSWFDRAPEDSRWIRLSASQGALAFTCFCEDNEGNLSWMAMNPFMNSAERFKSQSAAAESISSLIIMRRVKDFASGVERTVNPSSPYIQKVLNYAGIGEDHNEKSPDAKLGELSADIAGVLGGRVAGSVSSGGTAIATNIPRAPQFFSEAEAIAKGLPYTVSNMAKGRAIHNLYKLADRAPELGRFKEFAKIPKIRPDFVDEATRTIYELKPYNPRGIREGAQQLEKYKKAFEAEFGGTWKTVLEFY